jgi:hypothetical protein
MRLLTETDSLPRQLGLVYLSIAALVGLVFRFWDEPLQRLAFCALRRHTGVPCPTCGGTHAAAALARLDPVNAFVANPLLTLVALLILVWGVHSLAATLVPRWRRQLQLSDRDRLVLRWAIFTALLATWAYNLLHLT